MLNTVSQIYIKRYSGFKSLVDKMPAIAPPQCFGVISISFMKNFNKKISIHLHVYKKKIENVAHV